MDFGIETGKWRAVLMVRQTTIWLKKDNACARLGVFHCGVVQHGICISRAPGKTLPAVTLLNFQSVGIDESVAGVANNRRIWHPLARSRATTRSAKRNRIERSLLWLDLDAERV